jgi:hypothetical protein
MVTLKFAVFKEFFNSVCRSMLDSLIDLDLIIILTWNSMPFSARYFSVEVISLITKVLVDSTIF